MISRPILLALGAALGGLALAPVTASAAWLEPMLLSGAGQHATSPRAALDDDGDALIVWGFFDGAKYRVQSRSRSRAGLLGPVQTLSAAGQDAYEPKVAIDDDGDAIVTWYRFDGAKYRIQARARSSAGVLSATATLSEAGANAFSPQAAIDDGGDGIVVWYRFDGALNRVQARSRSSAGVWGGLVNVSPADDDGALPAVDIDQDGDALVVWQNVDAANGLQRIESRARSSSGTFGPRQALSSVTAAGAQVALAPDGTATVVWQRDGGTGDRIEGRTRSAATWGPIKVLSDTPMDADQARAAAGAGSATALWRRFDGSNWRVESRPWLTSSWRPLTVLSPDDDDGAQAQLAMEESGGEAIAVWRRLEGSSYRIEASAGP